MDLYDDPDGDDFGPDEDLDTDMIAMNPPRWQRWRPARPVAVAGVAVVALAGGAGVGYAAAHSTAKPAADTSAVSAQATPSIPAPPPGARLVAPVWPGPGAGFRFFAVPVGQGGIGGVAHGEFAVPKPGGGYETLDVQSGTVTAVSATSVTVKSGDGYSRSYTVTSKTLVDAQAARIGSVKKGDSVFLTATVSGSTPTAADIYNLTAIKAGHAPASTVLPVQAPPTQPPS